MDDPTFPAVITVGGSGQTYRFSALPKEIHANQSFILTAVLSESAAPFDISGSTATLYVAGWKNEVPPVQLAVGSLSDSGGGTTDTVTFTVIKDLIPEIFGYLPLRKSGNSVFYFTLTDANSTLQFFQTVNIIDSDYSLSGEVQPSPNVIIPVRNDLGNVVSANLNTPPVSPALQDSYIIGTSPTGAWVGQNNDLTVWNGTAWVFYDTTEGNFAFDETASQQYTFSGVTWAPTAAITYANGEFIGDNNGNELIQFGVVSSAVNHPKFSNAATGNPAIIEAVGGDTNVDLLLHGQAAGNVKIADGTDNTKIIDVVASTIATGTTRTLTMPDANVDLANVNSALQNIVEDTTPQLGGTLDAQNNYISSLLGIGAKTSTTLTISSGSVTQTQLVHAIGTESAAATDDLDSIVPATGQTDLFLTMTASGQVPTIKHATGTNTFLLALDTDLVMVMNTIYHFRHDGTNWKLAGSGAAGGGGVVVQKKSSTTSTSTSTTTVIPFDNTIPQNTEGASCGLDLVYTPLDAANILYIDVSGFMGASVAMQTTLALFQDSTADALNATADTCNVGWSIERNLSYKMVAGTTSATTFKARFGSDTGTAYWMRYSGSDLYSTAKLGIMTITEVTP